MQELNAAIAELLSNAEKGNIIPAQLPTQIKAIQALADKVQQTHLNATSQKSDESILLPHAQFLNRVLHDLKNPLASIRGYGDLLNKPEVAGELNETQDQFLQVIRANTLQLESLINDVTLLNKLRTGIIQVKFKIDILKNIALIVEKATRPLANQLNRQLEFDIPSGLPLFNTDGELLSKAIIKLVENGLRYSPEGAGKVIVKGEATDNILRIIIKDNGCGMTKDELDHLGELFFRADNDIVRAYKGSGLGIPIVYGIVELLNGTHQVESISESGTTFLLQFEGLI